MLGVKGSGLRAYLPIQPIHHKVFDNKSYGLDFMLVFCAILLTNLCSLFETNDFSFN